MPLTLRDTLGWRLSPHARSAARSRGFPVAEVLLAAGDPALTYTCHHYGPDREAHVRGDLCVIVNQATQTVITVILNRHEYTDDTAVRQLRNEGLNTRAPDAAR